MAGKNGSVIIGIDGDDSGFKSTLTGIGKAAGKSIAAVAKMSTAIYAAGKAIGALGVKYNAEIEQLQTSFEVMTGSAEKAAEVVNRLRRMGAETPFEMTDLTRITQLLMQYGFTADDALEKMQMLGDISQGNAEAMNSIALGYAQMSSAGKVNLQDIKQMINGGFNPLQEISERTGESMASLYERISNGTMQVSEITESMKAATSEGGKFFQSMEKQSKTLNGQLSTLKDNANQFLGTLTEGMTEELRTELLPLANNIIAELQGAFDAGGVDGLIDAASNMIPDLLGMMTGRLEDAISGVSKWLPKGVDKIMSALPGLVQSASSAIPQIVTALFGVASTVVENLITMLPELVPMLAEGIGNIVVSAVTGIDKLIVGAFAGIEKAFHQGQEKLFGRVWVDTEDWAKHDFTMDVDVGTEAAKSEIETAYSTIRDVLNTDLLTDEQKKQILENIDGDYDSIKAQLMSFGISETEAGTMAEQITGAGQTIKDEIAKLDVGADPATIMKWFFQAKGSNVMLIAYAKAAGLSDDDIDDIVKAYNTANGRLETETPNIAETIFDTLTDGLEDDEETIGSLKEKVSTYVEGKLKEANEAYEAELAKLDPEDPDYAQKVADLQAEYEATTAAINDIYDKSNALIDNLAGKSTAEVLAHYEELAELEQQINGLDKRLEEIYGKMLTQAEQAYQVVRSGAKADDETIDLAISGKVTEFKINEQSAIEEYNKARDELIELYTSGKITKDEYETRLGEEETKRDDAIAAYRAAFEKAYAEIIQGIAESEGVDDALEKAFTLTNARVSLQSLLDGGIELTDTGALDKLKRQLAEVLGEEFDADYFDMLIKNAEGTGDPTALYEWLANLVRNVEGLETDALGDALGGKTGEILNSAIEQGILEGTKFDAADNAGLLTGLYKAMFDTPPDAESPVRKFSETIDEYDFSPTAQRAEQNLERAWREANSGDLESTTEDKIEQMLDIDPSNVDYDPQKIAEQLQIKQKAEELNNAIITAFNSNQSSENPLSLTDIFGNLNMSADDIAGIADAMGLTPVALLNQLNSTLRTGDTTFGSDVSALITGMFDSVDLSGVNDVGDDIGAGVGEGMVNHDYSGDAGNAVGAIEDDLRGAAQSHSPAQRFVPIGSDIAAGVAQGISGYDASGAAGGLVGGIADAISDEKPNVQKAGESLATGAAVGILTKAYVAKEAAAAMARAIVAKIRSVFDSHSPSRVAIAIGNDFGDGMSIGLREGLTRAVNVAQRMSGEIVTAASLPNMSYMRNMPDIASEITVANEQSATPVLLDGKQIAEIQGHNNSSVIAWRNTKAAKGVGSR